MYITSDFKYDIPTDKPKTGSYEWWYFDAKDDSGHWSIVVIFYEGCPFSPRYNKMYDDGGSSTASDHPAISISLYYDFKPVFYSMTEYKPQDCSFKNDGDEIRIKVGDNFLFLRKSDGKLFHTLQLNEKMPSGDILEGLLHFESIHNPDLFTKKPEPGQHHWNLTQPRAMVNGILELKTGFGGFNRIYWKGKGYHDHNLGFEPMMNEFDDWYWGRFHYKAHTLVYYLMRKNGLLEIKGWLFDKKQNLLNVFEKGKIANEFNNLFGLTAATEIHLNYDSISCRIYQRNIVDKGPFYYRFIAESTLQRGNEVERVFGFTEYIKPKNIHKKVYWPLINMRYHYKGEANWVQKSPIFYRWTWKGL